ncbi:Thioredoxin domain-containing protein [Kerstersia similis]
MMSTHLPHAAMPVLFPYSAAATTVTPATASRLVVCFCAQWCDTCRAYLPTLEALSEKYPEDCFAWIDIEDQPEFLGDVDVENFPTLLVMEGERTVFFGPMLPHIGHLDRLLAQAPADTHISHELPDVRSLLQETLATR